MPAQHPSPQSLGENIANSLSHGCGVASILVTLPSLLAAAHTRGGRPAIVGASIFAMSALLLYGASTIYHATPAGGAKRFLRRCDHSAIFLLIAGTYTPFALGVLRGPWGWSLGVAVWGLALVGVVRELFTHGRPQWLSLALYLGMGWLAVVAIGPILDRVPLPGILLLLAGGLAYSLGTVFYAYDRCPYFHFTWHLFVLAGTLFHYFAVRNYAA
jgi:hemolysin III